MQICQSRYPSGEDGRLPALPAAAAGALTGKCCYPAS